MQWLEPRPVKRLPIRLTPLIDVVFILLLFFMLSSRLDPMGLLELETAEPGSASEEIDDTPARLHLTPDTLLWNDDELSEEALEQELAEHDGERVLLSTDGDLALGVFTRWLTQIEDAGLTPQWQRDAKAEGDGS